MIGFFIFLQIVCCGLLVLVVLMQSGRGGGLAESFVAAESMFGAKTNEMMVRATVVLAAIFLINSLVLAKLSAKQDRSLISGPMSAAQNTKVNLPKMPAAPTATSEKSATMPVTTNQAL